MAESTRSGRFRPIPWLVVLGVLLAALSMRGPIVAPTPVLGSIADDLVLSGSTAGLITTVPVLAFAAFTPLAAFLVRRAGAEIAVLLTLCGVLAGTLVRSIPGFGWMLAGMLMIGIAITIGNVVMPVIIRRDVPPERVTIVTAGYTAMLNLGSLLAAIGTAPIAAVLGWPLALMSWGTLAVAGLVLWGVHMRRDRGARAWAERDSGRGPRPGPTTGPQPTVDELTGPMPVVQTRSRAERPAWRIPIAWLLAVAFGMQSFAYYGVSTWLPTFLADTLGADQSSAGALASMFQAFGIAGAFLVPLISRYAPQIVAAAVVCGCWLTLALGLLLAPELFLVWVVFGGLGQAGGFVVIFTTLVRVARGAGEAAGMSALVQGGGYVIAASSAPLIGLLHQLSDGWTLPMLVIATAVAVFTVCVLAGVGTARRADASTAG